MLKDFKSILVEFLQGFFFIPSFWFVYEEVVYFSMGFILFMIFWSFEEKTFDLNSVQMYQAWY